MQRIDVTVRPNQDGWWAEIKSIPGCYSHGESLDELKKNIREAIDLHIEGLLETDKPINNEFIRGEYELDLKINIQDLFEYYPITVKGISERAGMNRSLLNQYVKGEKTMSEKQALRIIGTIHQLGSELMQLQL
ncbi:MAG: type II toxin-antitoxin system HicB family antitoxin [Prolixibacteraceae bacterium]|nr:type II toxin-antitoxin system HicB family antitoxin [Prolixibacteraceae bacterium]